MCIRDSTHTHTHTHTHTNNWKTHPLVQCDGSGIIVHTGRQRFYQSRGRNSWRLTALRSVLVLFCLALTEASHATRRPRFSRLIRRVRRSRQCITAAVKTASSQGSLSSYTLLLQVTSILLRELSSYYIVFCVYTGELWCT